MFRPPELEGRSLTDGENDGASLQEQCAGQQATQGDQAAQQQAPKRQASLTAGPENAGAGGSDDKDAFAQARTDYERAWADLDAKIAELEGEIAQAAKTADAAENLRAEMDELTATYDNGIELIKDRVSQLGWEDMERLVAGMLKAMGYCARVIPKGPDGGRDVIASPDALGLESPRIVAEVKHRKGAMGAPAVRSFIGGLRADDRGLYVSTGGFTKEARYEADRANVPVRLLDLDAFVRHYVEVYDKADDETRGILPLTRIWWPA